MFYNDRLFTIWIKYIINFVLICTVFISIKFELYKLTYKTRFVDWTCAAQSSISSERRREAGGDPGGSGNSGDDCRVVLRGGL